MWPVWLDSYTEMGKGQDAEGMDGVGVGGRHMSEASERSASSFSVCRETTDGGGRRQLAQSTLAAAGRIGFSGQDWKCGSQ